MLTNATLPQEETPGLKAKVGEIEGVTYFYLVDGLENEARVGEREDSDIVYTKGVRAADAVETVIKEGLAYLLGLENEFEEIAGEELGFVGGVDEPVNIETTLLKILEVSNSRVHSQNIDGGVRNAAYHTLDGFYGDNDGPRSVIDAGVSCAYGVIVGDKVYGISYGNVALVSWSKEQWEADTPADEFTDLETPALGYTGSNALLNDGEGRLAVRVYQAELGKEGRVCARNKKPSEEEETILDLGLISIINIEDRYEGVRWSHRHTQKPR